MAHSGKRKRLAMAEQKQKAQRIVGYDTARECHVVLTSTGKQKMQYRTKTPSLRERELSKVVTSHWQRHGMG